MTSNPGSDVFTHCLLRVLHTLPNALLATRICCICTDLEERILINGPQE